MIRKNALRAVLFDLDGTLTDPREGITNCIRYALSAFGIEETDEDVLTSFIGPPLMESFTRHYGFSEEKARAAVNRYRERFSTVGLFENRVYPGAADALRQLKQSGLLLALATSKPWVYARKICEKYALSESLDEICGPELDGTRDEKREVIAYALRRLNVRAEQALMVGDRKHDIQGAHACGVAAWGVSFGYGSVQELREAGAERIVGSFDELLANIQSL